MMKWLKKIKFSALRDYIPRAALKMTSISYWRRFQTTSNIPILNLGLKCLGWK